jgi:hypothetical protein
MPPLRSCRRSGKPNSPALPARSATPTRRHRWHWFVPTWTKILAAADPGAGRGRRVSPLQESPGRPDRPGPGGRCANAAAPEAAGRFIVRGLERLGRPRPLPPALGVDRVWSGFVLMPSASEQPALRFLELRGRRVACCVSGLMGCWAAGRHRTVSRPLPVAANVPRLRAAHGHGRNPTATGWHGCGDPAHMPGSRRWRAALRLPFVIRPGSVPSPAPGLGDASCCALQPR